MKIVDYVFYSGPAKWVILYILIMSLISILLASFKPQSITDNIDGSIDSSFYSSQNKGIKKSSLLVNNKEKKNPLKNNLKVKANDVSSGPSVKYLKEYSEKYKALIFNEIHYPFTIDYQDNLKYKNVVFYVLVDDIFEEDGRTYMKAAKSYMGLNVYLKLQCNKSLTKKLRSEQYYTYIVARITKISNIYFNSKAISSKNSYDATDVDINLVSNNKNLMIIGRCLDMF